MCTELKKNAALKVEWKTSVYDYSESKVQDIIDKLSKKYGIEKKRIKVETNFVNVVDGKEEEISIKDDVIGDIQSPAFQQSLFKEYLKLNDVKDYDLDALYTIDNEVNSRIDYSSFENGKTYKIKWLKWSNFLSYGDGNIFDFDKYKGLVLLNSTPANQAGKTTFAIDLVHFIFFGKTSKTEKQEDIFNRRLPQATNVVGEMCIRIDGVDYIIKRTLTRPTLEKRTEKSTVKSSIEYYRVVGDTRVELSEYSKTEELNEESVGQTNKIIKEAIGNEDDFDLTMCATSKTLDELIDKKSTERGRILARWIGLLPLEKKDEVAKEIFNRSIRDSLLVGKYNKESLQDEIAKLTEDNEKINKDIIGKEEEIKKTQEDIASEHELIKTLSELKYAIDGDVLKIDATTVQNKIDEITTNGKNKKVELESLKKEIESLENVTFNSEEYSKVASEREENASEIASKETEIRSCQTLINQLKNSEVCPTCGRKYDNIDNSKKIKEYEDKVESIRAELLKLKNLQENLRKLSEGMSEAAAKEKKRGEKIAKSASIEVTLSNMRAELIEKKNLLKEYEKNKEAINKNNELDLKIASSEGKLKALNLMITTFNNSITEYKSSITRNNTTIENDKALLERLSKDEITLRNWKMYMDIIGKNGIGKMVMRKALPIINANISRLLDGVCDFTVNVIINDKNEIDFLIVQDGIVGNLHSASGFEMTASALALRTVLANISTMSKPQFIVLDEVLGRVAKENYENMHSLYEKILESYELILQVSHLHEITDWHSAIVTVKKENGISSVSEEIIKK